MSDNYERLLEYIRTLEVIDTHEHLPPYENEREQHTDILQEYIQQYFGPDLISAGLPPEQYNQIMRTDNGMTVTREWEILERYWDFARLTGYGRALDNTVKMLYGIPCISAETVEEADLAFKAARASGTHYKRVLKDVCNIQVSLVDVGRIDCDDRFFKAVFPAHSWIRPDSVEAMKQMSKSQGIRLNSLSDYEEALRSALTDAKAKGAVAIKCALAYQRSIKFERPSRSDAEDAFARAFAFNHAIAWQDRSRPDEVFEDYMMHYVCHLTGELNLPFQIHTGLQEGNGNLLSSSDPLLLNNLFFEYPETRFDIFHIGYPWHIQLAALAKNFPNVYIDMCWSHIISPNAAVCALDEYLDAVPANKIMAFGGDYGFIDAVAGHLEQARINVARALARKTAIGAIDMERAEHLAKMLFYDNPANLFGL